MNLIELDLARDGFGNPLDPGIRRKLVALLENPCQETWDEAHGIILCPHGGFGTTVWKAVLAVDPTFPVTGKAWRRLGNGERVVTAPWPRIPDLDLLLRALRYATH